MEVRNIYIYFGYSRFVQYVSQIFTLFYLTGSHSVHENYRENKCSKNQYNNNLHDMHHNCDVCLFDIIAVRLKKHVFINCFLLDLLKQTVLYVAY